MKISIVTLRGKDIQDFAKARNEALDKVVGEWVLFLDSDEIISPALKKEIGDLNPDPRVNGYYIKRVGIVEEEVLRLARKDKGRWYRQVHEAWRVKGRIGRLRNVIIHKDEDGVFEMVRKANFYSTLHAKANKLEGKRSNLFKIVFFPVFKFIQTLFIKKAYKKGIRGFVFSIFQSFQSFLSWTKLYFSSI